MSSDSFGARSSLEVGGREYEIFRLDALQERFDVARLPYSIKVLLENVLRLEDGVSVSAADVEAIAAWDAAAEPSVEIPFQPARVLMQDFTGVPAVVDLAAMRDAMEEIGGDPAAINPLVDVDLVIDHSVQVDAFGNERAFAVNAEHDFERNLERYSFLKWGQQSFDNFRVVPPATGICHQVNLEYLSQVVYSRENGGTLQAYPDTLVGTDSHTTMVNGLGVLGWGVGGIEAEAAMLGQPISMLLPQVVGFKLSGELPEGATATDLVLTVTEMLRERGVVSKFVEFFGPGLPTLGLADRATLGNMSPEFGSTCAIFPVDAETLRYLDLTGRPTETIELVDAYAREQGMFHDESAPTRSSPTCSSSTSARWCRAWPARNGRRTGCRSREAKESFLEAMREFDPEAAEQMGNGRDEAIEESFPASDPPAEDHDDERGKPRPAVSGTAVDTTRSHDAIAVTLADGTVVELDHGHVVIAAITSCTNTSNPSVMVGAGLLARNAVERGPRAQAVGEDLAGAGIDRRHRLPRAAPGLTEYLDALQFNLVGYGCTTCIGNSGPLAPEISAAIAEKDLAVCAVLSGNRNFEGRINQDVKANYLASPPLVVAYALAGRMDIDLVNEPLGEGQDGEPVFLRDVWPERRGDQAGGRRLGRKRRCSSATTPGSSPATRCGTRSTSPPATATPGPTRPTSAAPASSSRCRPQAPGRRADRRRPRAGGARRLDHHRPHLARRRDQTRQPRRPLADRAGGRRQGLQLLRLAPRQPRGDDPRHLRQHPPPQPAGRARRRLHPALPRRRETTIYDAAMASTQAKKCPWSCWPARSTAPAPPATGRRRGRSCSASGR